MYTDARRLRQNKERIGKRHVDVIASMRELTTFSFHSFLDSNDNAAETSALNVTFVQRFASIHIAFNSQHFIKFLVSVHYK